MWNMFHFKVLDVALLSFDVFNVNYQDITNTNQLLPFHIFFKKVCAIFATYENKSPPLFLRYNLRSRIRQTNYIFGESLDNIFFLMNKLWMISLLSSLYIRYIHKNNNSNTRACTKDIYVLLICKQGQHIFHQTTNYHCRV